MNRDIVYGSRKISLEKFEKQKRKNKKEGEEK